MIGDAPLGRGQSGQHGGSGSGAHDFAHRLRRGLTWRMLKVWHLGNREGASSDLQKQYLRRALRGCAGGGDL